MGTDLTRQDIGWNQRNSSNPSSATSLLVALASQLPFLPEGAGSGSAHQFAVSTGWDIPSKAPTVFLLCSKVNSSNSLFSVCKKLTVHFLFCFHSPDFSLSLLHFSVVVVPLVPTPSPPICFYSFSTSSLPVPILSPIPFSITSFYSLLLPVSF